MPTTKARIIAFPDRGNARPSLSDTISGLERQQLLELARDLVALAMEATDTGDLHDRTRAAYAALECILVEGNRL